MTDYSKMTQADFDYYLEQIVRGMNSMEIFQMPGVYEIVSEELNNEVLDSWKRDQELDE